MSNAIKIWVGASNCGQYELLENLQEVQLVELESWYIEDRTNKDLLCSEEDFQYFLERLMEYKRIFKGVDNKFYEEIIE